MELERADFWVTNVHFVIDRAAEPGDGNRNLCYPDHYVLVFCIAGQGVFLTDGRKILMQKNDVCLLPPGNVRTYTADLEDPWHYISVSFDLSYGGEPGPASTEAVCFPTSSARVREHFLGLSAAWQHKDLLYKVKCRTSIQEILCLLLTERLETRSNVPQEIIAAKQYIQQHFTQDILLDSLAADAGFSASHFRKLFSRYLGRSPKQYILYLRLSKARDLLAATGFRVGEVARLCGFRNEFYFSSLFKQTYGISPKAYRSAPH